MTFLFCRRRFCCFPDWGKNSLQASVRADAKCCAPVVSGRACQPLLDMLHLRLYIFADSVIWGDGSVHRAEDQANVSALFDRAGRKSRQRHPNITFIFTRVHVLKGKKGLLLCKCTGRVCGEVQTFLAHPVWDSLSCIFCPKLLSTHMQRRAQQTCGPCLITPYAPRYAGVRRERTREIRTGAHLFPARANTLADCRHDIRPKWDGRQSRCSCTCQIYHPNGDERL